MAKPQEGKPAPAAKPAAPNYKAYEIHLQASINADIQAVKAGSLDEELLRARIMENFDQNGAHTQLALWLCALANGLIDDLAVIAKATIEGPVFEFFPQWDSKQAADTPILRLPVPGAAVQTRPAIVTPSADPALPSLPAQAALQA